MRVAMGISILHERNSLMLRAEHEALTAEDARVCAKHLADQKGQALVILDFLRVASIAPDALVALDKLAEPSSKDGAKIIVLARRRLIEQLKDHPLGTAALCYMDLSEETHKKRSAVPKDPDIKRIVEVVLDAVAYAFKFYGKITISPQEPRFWSEKEAPLIEIAGTAGIVSKSFRGSVVLGFPLKTFLAVVSRILDTPSTRIESSNRDWPAELLNVVLGQTRAALSQEEIEVSTAIPTVVHGASFEMIHSKAASCIVIPLKSDCGDLFLQVSTIRA